MITHLITGGCSFSTGDDTNGWTGYTTQFLKNINPNLKTAHTGKNSAGQEYIQKRIVSTLCDLMKQGANPHEMLVVVMWSGTSRKTWFIDNPLMISRMVNGWPNFHGGMTDQFLSLTNNGIEDPWFFTTKNGSEFRYNHNGGWYLTVNGSDCQLEFVQQHYLLDKEVNGVGKTHSSLENIIFLQNFCKLHGIKLVSQFFMKHVYVDIERHKDHEIISYLYDQLDQSMMIKMGMFEYLHKDLEVSEDDAVLLTHEERKFRQNKYKLNYFAQDGFHPADQGNMVWCNEILIPFINEQF